MSRLLVVAMLLDCFKKMLLAVRFGPKLTFASVCLFLLIKGNKTEESVLFWIFFCLLFQMGQEIKDLCPFGKGKFHFCTS